MRFGLTARSHMATQVSRASLVTCVAEAPLLLDQMTSLHAVGFTSLIQAVRDSTQDFFGLARSVLLPAIVGWVLATGAAAWVAGARYSSRNAAGAKLTSEDFTLLLLCISLDAFGDSSFLFGESGDFIWAPLSAWILRALFESDILAAFNFVKELLPLTDVLPLATIAWLSRYAFPDSAAARLLGLEPQSDGDDGGEFW